jgi:CheY-like chemotaxis protein
MPSDTGPPGHRPVPPNAPPAPETKAGRVLVVDDEPLILESIRLVLSNEFAVVVTTLPEQALAWMTPGASAEAGRPPEVSPRVPFDVVLCDVMMPGMNGIELRDRIHAVSPEQAARIVFVTGGALLPHVRAMLERVPNAWLEKPIDMEGLREFVRRRAGSAAAAAGMGDVAWRTSAPGV